MKEFLKNHIDFKEATPNEVQKMEWPRWYLPLSDPRSKPGVDYIRDVRGLQPAEGMYYDSNRNGIVFPYYFGNVFVGAQTRFIDTFTDADGTERKIDTLPGSRLGLLFYNWNQVDTLPSIRGFIVTEDAFDTQAIQQATNAAFGGITKNPWRAIACSGSGATTHHLETMKEMRLKGYKIILAPDADEAGVKMLEKFSAADAITHCVSPGSATKDWNDLYREIDDPKNFIKWLMGRIESVE